MKEGKKGMCECRMCVSALTYLFIYVHARQASSKVCDVSIVGT